MPRENLLEGKKILIVDDEPDVLDTLEELLSICSTMRASDFDEAKRLLETERFDMAILDIMGVRGYELVEIALKHNVIPVMLTANALSPESVVESYKKGAAFYVPKDKISEIAIYLSDVLDAGKEGKHSWWRWLERFNDYFAKKFGSEWQRRDKEFWQNISHYGFY